MSASVWKWQIHGGALRAYMPEGATILHVAVQGGVPCFWALVDPEAPTEPRRFRVVGTGHPIDDVDVLTFVGTFLLDVEGLVFHVFEVPSTTTVVTP